MSKVQSGKSKKRQVLIRDGYTALMAADSLLRRRAFFTAGKRRPTEARFPARKKASREKAGSVQQDWLQKKTDSFHYRFFF